MLFRRSFDGCHFPERVSLGRWVRGMIGTISYKLMQTVLFRKINEELGTTVDKCK